MSYFNPNAPTPAILRIPMPVPGTTDAPLFNGERVSDFLRILEHRGTSAGISSLDELVPYILMYSADGVKEVIRYMPEFDDDIPNKTWSIATATLRLLYGASDPVSSVTEEDLTKYCRASYTSPAFPSKQAVDEYHRGFQSLAAPLVKYGFLSPTQRDFSFITGIPASLRDWYFRQVPESKQSRSNPPSIPESISYLYQRFDTNSLYSDPWVREQEPAPVNEADRDAQSTLMLSVSQVEELMQRTVEKVIEILRERQTNSESPHQHQSSRVRDGSMKFHRCFVCGRSGDGLTHPLHPSRCPETRALLSEGLIVFNRSSSRYTLPNGDDLPNVRGFEGGVAAFVRLVSRAESDRVFNYTNFTGSVFNVRDVHEAGVTTTTTDQQRSQQSESLSTFPAQPKEDESLPPTAPPACVFDIPTPIAEPHHYSTFNDQTESTSHMIFDTIMYTSIPVSLSQFINMNSSPRESFGVTDQVESVEVSPSEHSDPSDSCVPLYSVNVQSPLQAPIPTSPSYNSIPRSRVANQVHQSAKVIFPWLFQSTERDLYGVDDEVPEDPG